VSTHASVVIPGCATIFLEHSFRTNSSSANLLVQKYWQISQKKRWYFTGNKTVLFWLDTASDVVLTTKVWERIQKHSNF